ncbi:putative adenylosuccinate lyase [Cardiosporidium cionae]|uniref:Adenylosuccinate lyase n=1 Tax=Cardiosporidium cionae TaxID=476202 RepID=A0ABQ7JES0_9APIC|nr:putative adenylosuccinate lyase [Cardiosporidium cionae]|eukprot:KAF8822489.1 putative adenylosuccinate lyase [Cardiosporidium cionae]
MENKHCLEGVLTKDDAIFDTSVREAEDVQDSPSDENFNSVEDSPEGFATLSNEDLLSLKGRSEEEYIRIIDEIASGRAVSPSIRGGAKNVSAVAALTEDSSEEKYVESLDPLTDSLIVDEELNASTQNPKVIRCLLETAHLVPMRLSYAEKKIDLKFVQLHMERRILALLESTLEVSDYTDKIDIYCGGNEARRINREIKQLCAILSGLAIAHNYEDGQRLLRDYNFAENAEFFQTVFEIGRRYKILNPERMRNTYGKLMYVLMDCRKQTHQDLLEFDAVKPIQTVYSLLKKKVNGLELLKDPLVLTATMEIIPHGKSRATIQKEIRTKENAIKTLSQRYSSEATSRKNFKFFGLNLNLFNRYGLEDEDETVPKEHSDGLTPEEIEQCLYSIGDHNTYLRFNRDPCDHMIDEFCDILEKRARYLKENFKHNEPERHFSLSISMGHNGARLTHSHQRQYEFVYQSLILWREIAQNMLRLWHYVERDLLDPRNTYRLRDTGQGLNRIQFAPYVEREMNNILETIRRKVGSWVGSSVVHLGDRNVPNSLMFIDKYTQVPRILTPIILCLDKLPELYESSLAMKEYIDKQFHGLTFLRKSILCDFFRHGFDGSGADSFFDAGSCIDGRLTSAWNWCSSVEKKPYFPIFLLTGFSGFDGKF